MDKVMTRAATRADTAGVASGTRSSGQAAIRGPGTRTNNRPPGRRDPRRPGGIPQRASGAHPRLTRSGEPQRGVPQHGAPQPRVPQPCPPRPTDVFAEKLLAVLSGQRPVHWMLRHTAGRAYDELAWLADRSPLATGTARPVVRDVGYFLPRAGAVEAFARIATGDRVRAMAFRLERGADHRWRCTAIELGGPDLRRPAEAE